MFFPRFFPGLTGSRPGRAVGWLWLAVLAVVCVRAGLHPLKQSILAADYLPAGAHWLRGEEVYRRHHGFLYSPPVAAFFAPWSLLPAAVGAVLWRLAGTGVLLAVADRWLRGPLPGLGDPGDLLTARDRASRTVPVAFGLFLPMAVGNVNLGQMNLVVLTLVLGSVLAVWRERWNLAAVLLAVAAFVKIYPLAVGLLLVLLYPRELSWRLALALVATFALSLLLGRPGYVWTEYHEWFAVLGRDDRLDVDAAVSWRDFGALLRAFGVTASAGANRAMEAAAGGALALFLLWGQRRARWGRARLLGGVFCLGCAWMILFGPATEAATYLLLALPLCGTLAAAWTLPPGTPGRSVRRVLAAVYVLLLWSGLSNSWLHGRRLHLYLHALEPAAALLFAGAVAWWLTRPLPAAPAGPMLADADNPSEDGGGDRRLA